MFTGFRDLVCFPQESQRRIDRETEQKRFDVCRVVKNLFWIQYAFVF